MIRHLLLILLLSNGFANGLKAQLGKYRFAHIGTGEGVLDNVINDIKQDAKGFMLFATNNGLQRYDGYRFFNYHFEFGNNKSLPSDNVGRIIEDEKGNIWVACNTGVAEN